MTSIDIVISNDRHHWAMAKPLVDTALRRGHMCRILSLCEFRGMTTPAEASRRRGLQVVQLSRVQRPRTMKGKGTGSRSRLSKLTREAAWRLTLAGNVKKALDDRPDVVVLFNDAAYPYDRLCRVLRDRSIPFLLVQEGIRYDVADTAQEGSLNQGKGGATAIAAWGESSAGFFERQGAPPEAIHLTGNPRFDLITSADLKTEAARIGKELGLEGPTILFLSNPVEFHGYCTGDEKLKMVRDFVTGIEPLLADGRTTLLFKLHSHENIEDYRVVAASSPHAERIVFATDQDLYPLFQLVDAAVIFSTTAGLEAMLFGVPLGVLEIPGVGFIHDYVEQGAATPLRWSEPMADQVEALLARKGRVEPQVEKYLDRALASRTGATDRALDLAEGLSRGRVTPDLAQQTLG